jgi:hypothetical protein
MMPIFETMCILLATDLDRLVEDHPRLTKWQRFRTIGSVFERAAATQGLYSESAALVRPIRGWEN